MPTFANIQMSTICCSINRLFFNNHIISNFQTEYILKESEVTSNDLVLEHFEVLNTTLFFSTGTAPGYLIRGEFRIDFVDNPGFHEILTINFEVDGVGKSLEDAQIELFQNFKQGKYRIVDIADHEYFDPLRINKITIEAIILPEQNRDSWEKAVSPVKSWIKSSFLAHIPQLQAI